MVIHEVFQLKLNPAEATKMVNHCARQDALNLGWTTHAKDRLIERDLLIDDLMALLKNGFILDEPVPATREGVFKYQIEGTTPNSNGRIVKAVIIPDGKCFIKIVTIMWKDEK